MQYCIGSTGFNVPPDNIPTALSNEWTFEINRQSARLYASSTAVMEVTYGDQDSQHTSCSTYWAQDKTSITFKIDDTVADYFRTDFVASSEGKYTLDL